MISIPIYYSFFAGLLISIIGTLPPGLITLNILDKSLHRSLIYGLLLGAGAIAVELVQITVSCLLVNQMLFSSENNKLFSIFSSILFLGIGIFYLRKKPTSTSGPKKNVNVTNPILLGSALSLLNLLAIPYWVFYIGFLKTNQLFDGSIWQIICLLLGAFIGTSIVFSSYAFLAQLIKNKLIAWIGLSNYFIGSIFLSLAIFQLIQIIR